jgi:hypothetical protein
MPRQQNKHSEDWEKALFFQWHTGTIWQTSQSSLARASSSQRARLSN